MSPVRRVLIDSGPIVAYYNSTDEWHQRSRLFYEKFKGELLTTESVVTEVMYLLSSDWRVQNEFLTDCSIELYHVIPLELTDFDVIARLNEKYRDLPGDFADLSLVALAERLHVFDVVSLDADFNIYRSYNKKSFRQVFST